MQSYHHIGELAVSYTNLLPSCKLCNILSHSAASRHAITWWVRFCALLWHGSWLV